MRKVTECPLCSANLVHTLGQAVKATFQTFNNDICLINCSVCGKFNITIEAVVNAQSTGSHHPKVSAWTRQESEAGRIAQVTTAELEDPPNIFGGLSVESKLLRALRTLAQEHPSPGTVFALETHDWLKFCDSGENEFGWMLNELGKRSWLNLSNAQTFADFYRGEISAAGWQALESAKRLDLQRAQSSNIEAKIESPYVFLCHASEDKEIAIAIAQQTASERYQLLFGCR